MAQCVPHEWEYPLYTIGVVGGGEVVAVDFEGRSCVLIYRTKELAELYVEQAGATRLKIIAIENASDFRRGLESLPPDVGFTIWDSVLQPQSVSLVAVRDLLESLHNS